MNDKHTDFAQKVRSHMAQYKTNILGINEDGEYNCRKYSHILPKDLEEKNIIDKPFGEEIKKLLTFKKHDGFAHLNSSQAMALNLFGPLVVTNKLGLITSDVSENAKVEFEHIEDKEEYTNFDFYICDDGKKIFFEVKYTEKFDAEKNDEHHQNKYKKTYESRLNDIADITEDEFFKEYQLWRNILYTQNGTVYFVFPKTRSDLRERVELAKTKIKSKEIAGKIRILEVDDLVNTCKKDSELSEHYTEFENKYLKI